MSKVIEGDILNIKTGVIVHQCNCKGSMGAGIAKSISQKWPKVLKPYRTWCDADGAKNMGKVQFIIVDRGQGDNIVIANLFGQIGYGRGGNYTVYGAHERGWRKISEYVDKTHKIYAPFLIGAGLAGGDWRIIHDIAETYVPDIIWVKYKKGISFEF